MTEELKPELAPIEGNENKNEPLPLEEQVSLELVKHNYTEAKLQEFEEYLKLDIVDGDKEAYLLIKDKRKEVKSYRVAVEKFCKFKREDYVKIQKAWVSKENELVDKISKIEDYLEGKEKAYEKKIAEEKEARKRKQEEQLILRQQKLTAMGALYSEGNFILGDVSFEFSAIKESEDDIWNETIYPSFYDEYQKIQAEEIEKARLQQEREAELKRQQEELERKQKELADKEAELKQEQERQDREAEARWKEKIETRTSYLTSLGLSLKKDGDYVGHGLGITSVDIEGHDDAEWSKLMDEVTAHVELCKQNEAEEKRKEQERIDLQNKRYAELLPFKEYGEPVAMDQLWQLAPDVYLSAYDGKKMAFEKAEEEKANRIAEEAAKKERERIEEEQRQAKEIKRQATIAYRSDALKQYGSIKESDWLGDLKDDEWDELLAEARDEHDEIVRKQEEERRAEELAQASDKVKWEALMVLIKSAEDGVNNYPMRSGQYRKKAAILREKLEEIKSL